MLPEPDPHVLHSHPKFAALYKDLATNRLEQNGSSKVSDVKKVKERAVFREVCLAFVFVPFVARVAFGQTIADEWLGVA